MANEGGEGGAGKSQQQADLIPNDDAFVDATQDSRNELSVGLTPDEAAQAQQIGHAADAQRDWNVPQVVLEALGQVHSAPSHPDVGMDKPVVIKAEKTPTYHPLTGEPLFPDQGADSTAHGTNPPPSIIHITGNQATGATHKRVEDANAAYWQRNQDLNATNNSNQAPQLGQPGSGTGGSASGK